MHCYNRKYKDQNKDSETRDGQFQSSSRMIVSMASWKVWIAAVPFLEN